MKPGKDMRIKPIKYRFYVPEVINGFKLPPEPDEDKNNETLLGIDFNHNGIRDEVERWVITHYANDPKYPKTKTAIALQYAWASQKILENPTIESKKYLDDALDCESYWAKTKTKGLSGFDLVYLTGITLAVLAQHNPDPVMSLLQQLADGGTQIAFDPNHRDMLWDSAEIAKSVYRDIAPLLTFCLPTFDDEQRLFKDRDPTVTATRWLDWGAAEVIVKNGSKTALLATPWEQIHSYPIPIERVVDTTAAGDAFNGSYLVRRLVGDPSRLAADAAHTLAAQVIQHKGAIAPLA